MASLAVNFENAGNGGFFNNRYLQLQRALMVLDYGHDAVSRDRTDECEDTSSLRCVEFLVRGQHQNGNRYYGRARMTIGAGARGHFDLDGREITLNSWIEGASYNYSGSLRDSALISLDGEHKVRYWIGVTGDHAVGTWDNGLEELISARTNMATVRPLAIRLSRM